MSLSLEVKKFINSEHVGNYVEITLPGLPRAKGEEPTPETVKIHYCEAGVGEPLILIHTVGQSLYTWRKVFDALAQHYRVIAIDLLGHGYSSRPLEFAYTIEEQSEALRLFMNAIGIRSAHIVGFSMGALYALDFVANNPDRVGKVVLLSPGGLTQEMPTLVRMIDSTLFGSIACHLYNYKSVTKLLEECVFDLTTLTGEVLDGYYSTVADSPARKAIQLSLHNLDEENVAKQLRTIQHETLIIWGAEDKWHLPQSSELYHSALSNAQFTIIRNAGHLLHEEKPQRFIDALLEYIPVPINEK